MGGWCDDDVDSGDIPFCCRSREDTTVVAFALAALLVTNRPPPSATTAAMRCFRFREVVGGINVAAIVGEKE